MSKAYSSRSGRMGRTERMGVALLLLMMGVGVPGPEATEAGTLQRVKLTQPVSALTFLPIDVARANKYFEEEGIGLEVIVTQGDGPNVQALLAKDVDFSASAPHHLYRLYLEGKPLLGVVNMMNRSAINFVMHKDVAKQRGITAETPLSAKLKALKGLTIGVTRPGALTYHLAVYFTKKAGYQPQKDVQILAVGGGPAIIAALENRKVDIFAFSPPVPEQAVVRGPGLMFIDNAAGEDADLGEFLMMVLYVRPEYAREHPGMVRGMARALVRANAWIAQQPPDAIAKAVRPFFPTVSPELLSASVRTVKKAIVPDGRLTAKSSDTFQDIMLVSGALPRKVPFEAVLTNDYLPGGAAR